jgi:hypothetical protein
MGFTKGEVTARRPVVQRQQPIGMSGNQKLRTGLPAPLLAGVSASICDLMIQAAIA